MTDIYNEHAPKLIERGFYPIVIGPGTKKPQHYVPSLGEYHDTSGWANNKRPPDKPQQPGAGVGLRCGPQPGGGYVVGIDWDRDDAAIAALDAFPQTVSKTGQKGFTAFYYSDKPVPAKDFLIGKVAAAQVLGAGRQTVLPPTVHPDTGRPYAWDSEYTLYSLRPSDLPKLPEDYIERIEAILRTLGYEPAPEKPRSNGHDHDASENPYWDLNKLALRNLALWVPDLGLYKCKRKRGPHASYEAVATWRPSTTGRSLEERESHLSISGAKGIKDFGTGEGFSPIDLVMRARDCTLSEAVTWLMERVQVESGPEVDFDAIISPGIQPDTEEGRKDETREEAKGEEQPRKKRRFTFTRFWEMKVDADATPCVIDELIPLKGIVLLWGPPKCYKSFWVLDAFFHVAKGWEYRDRAVLQGEVMYCAFEGKHGYPKRVEALRRHYELETTDQTPITVMSGRTDLIQDHALLIKEIREELIGGRPIGVVLDTLNKSLVGSESKDVDMAAYIRAAEAVRDAFDCVVVIVHHCGWDESRMRGHSSLRGAIDAEISITREGEIVVATVEAMRDGPEGVQIVSRARIVEVGEDKGGRPLTSLVLVPHELTMGEATGKPRQWAPSLKVFREALTETLLAAGIDYQIEGGPKVKAVDLEKVRFTFYRLHVVASDEAATADTRQNARRMAFTRALDGARSRNLIGACVLEDGRQLVWLVQETSHAL
jgi:AAA domain/Bifunctional DNA primase/polymerase, N-terminal